jgi:HPt (histidine-containing phosphotransfer) domain-containing protein
MATYVNRAPLLDEEFLRQYLDLEVPGKPSVIKALVQRFGRSAPERMALVSQAVHELDAPRLRHEAHALKNIVANVGAASLAILCRRLETAGEKSDFGEVRELVDLASVELEEVRRALESRFLP